MEATLQRHAPNVHVREVFICHKGPRTIAITIVSGGEVLAVLAVLIKNVLGSSLTRATLIVVATEQRSVPNVYAINKVHIWVWCQRDEIIAMAIVSGGVTTSVVYAI